MRQYNFAADELLDAENPMLDIALDPKANWAMNHFHLFPVEINKVDFEILLRVPGIGPISARRIVRARRGQSLGFENIKKLGVVLKRACFFITCRGKKIPAVSEKSSVVYQSLAERHDPGPYQMKLFTNEPA
jgi:predicted DNA-binding helix-hairpin-helix protein